MKLTELFTKVLNQPSEWPHIESDKKGNIKITLCPTTVQREIQAKIVVI